MKFVHPDWPAPSNIRALVSTRHGGVSQTPFSSFNLALHVGDDAATVERNRDLLAHAVKLPAQPNWLTQTHSTIISMLDDKTDIDLLCSDGAITQTKNTVCAVMTADCLPLFLTNANGDKVGILHAGWKGLADGIIEKGVKAMNESPANLIAWAGPCISSEHFEIGQAVRDQMGGSDSAYHPSENANKWYADLYQLVGHRLESVGVNRYTHSQYCTYADKADFYSYRRDGQTGRMASLIWIS